MLWQNRLVEYIKDCEDNSSFVYVLFKDGSLMDDGKPLLVEKQYLQACKLNIPQTGRIKSK